MFKQADIKEIYKIFNQKNNNNIFIDVREPDEWKEGTIPDALKISLGEIKDNTNILDKNKNYIMVCRSGKRSEKASQIMENQGFINITNFNGGMLEWYKNNFPVSKT